MTSAATICSNIESSVQIAALLTSRHSAAQLRDAAPNADIHICARRADLLATARARHVDLVVTELRDVEGAPIGPMIPRIRECTPSVTIIAYLRLCSAEARELIPLTKAGVNGCVFRDIEDDRVNLRHLIARATQAQTRAIVAREAAQVLPAPAAYIVDRCLALPPTGTDVQGLAKVLGVHRKTLVNRMTRAGCLAPSAMLSWSRLLLASRLLEDSWRSVDTIADEVGFSDAATLRAVLRRYAHVRPSEVREGGGLRLMLHRFAEALSAPTRSTVDEPSAVDNSSGSDDEPELCVL